MFEVKSRSVESWGPLAECTESQFRQLVSGIGSKDKINTFLKKQKKLKTYRVQFKKVWNSEYFEIQAESEYEVQTVAKQFFKDNAESIGFKEQARNQWADGYAGYDTLSYVKVSK